MKNVIKIIFVIFLLLFCLSFRRIILNIQTPACWFSDNFHVVEEDKCYRSKQLTPEKLNLYVNQYQIKTILNLREKEEDPAALQQEENFAKEQNIAFINIPLNSCLFPSKENIGKILEIFESTPLPILVHCWSGTDRTGTVCALWVLEKMQQSIEEALKQLSFKYGHIKIVHPCMTKFVEIWSSLRKTKNQNAALESYDHTSYDEPFSILCPFSFLTSIIWLRSSYKLSEN